MSVVCCCNCFGVTGAKRLGFSQNRTEQQQHNPPIKNKDKSGFSSVEVPQSQSVIESRIFFNRDLIYEYWSTSLFLFIVTHYAQGALLPNCMLYSAEFLHIQTTGTYNGIMA